MDAETAIKLEAEYLNSCYDRFQLLIKKGKGSYLLDSEGKKYLDFVSGVATSSLGHSNPALKKCLAEAFDEFSSVSNLFYQEKQILLAQKLSGLTGLSNCFYSNSGAEAVEAAIKLARIHTGKKEIISTINGFHGRTFGALSATGKKAIKEKFEPLVPHFIHILYNDTSALEKAISSNTAAFIIEPIQGEAGIIIPSPDYLKEASELCSDKGVLLIADEVQTGMWRTGKFLASQWENIEPDILCMAKGLAGGFPLGVTMSKDAINFSKGDHGSTFGGNNIACSMALATLDFAEKKKLGLNAAKLGKRLEKGLVAIQKPQIIEVRVKGLMAGIETGTEAKKYSLNCITNGLLVSVCQEKTLRLLPPLTVKASEIDGAIGILEKAIQ